jgi:hypothetical protein
MLGSISAAAKSRTAAWTSLFSSLSDRSITGALCSPPAPPMCQIAKPAGDCRRVHEEEGSAGGDVAGDARRS